MMGLPEDARSSMISFAVWTQYQRVMDKQTDFLYQFWIW